MRSERVHSLIVGLLIFISCESILLIGLPSLKYFHRDEVNWIRISIYSFRTFFIERDFLDEGWSKYGLFGSRNPQVGKFIIGASLWLHGYRDFEGLVRWERYKHENLKRLIEQGIAPSSEELYAARVPIAILAAGTASLVFVLAAFAQRAALGANGLLSGILASLSFILHPLIQSSGRRAMLDIPAIFFSTLAMTLAVVSGLAFVRGLVKRSLLLGLGTAVAVGLAISTKMNALLIWLVVLLGAVGIAPRCSESHNRVSIRLLLVHAALQLGVPAAVFVLSNPFVYRNPVNGTRYLLALSSIATSKRQNHPTQALYTITEKLGSFADLGFGPIEQFFGRGNVDILLVGMGIVATGYVLLKGQQDRGTALIASMLLLWTTVIGVGVALWSPLAWKRYYVPWTPIASVWEGVGIAWLFAVFSKAFQRVLGDLRLQRIDEG